MRGPAFAAAVFLAVTGTAVAAVPQPIGPPAVFDENGTASIFVKPTAPAARPTTFSLSLSSYPLICGHTSAGTLVVTFPKAERLPAHLAVNAIRVSNGLARSASISGHTVRVSVAPPDAGGVTCQSIRMGRLTLTFTRAAKLGNPNAAGTYTVTAKHGTATYAAKFQVSS